MFITTILIKFARNNQVSLLYLFFNKESLPNTDINSITQDREILKDKDSKIPKQTVPIHKHFQKRYKMHLLLVISKLILFIEFNIV